MRAAKPAVPDLLESWLGVGLRGVLLIVGGLLLLALVTGLWFVFGRGPRSRRAYQRARGYLQQKQWRLTLEEVHALRGKGRLSKAWEGRVRNVEGEARLLAATEAREAGRFEEALEHHIAAAELLKLDAEACRRTVFEALLAEVRRRFAARTGPDVAEVLALVDRALALQPGCPEALFWQALCHVRAGRNEDALASLRASAGLEADGAAPKERPVDPLLYLGVLTMRAGKVQEALRHLAEANRRCPDCPFVGLQLGLAIVSGGGDKLAVRALQKALGPKGLPTWMRDARRAWAEGMPAADDEKGLPESYVRRLALVHPFHCPVLGGDIVALVCQGHLALAQAHSRLGHHAEAAESYEFLLKESAPSLAVLRGYGLALVRLDRHDQAFKHLRAAHERDPNDPRTAGYLAMCGALGKPNRAEDKANNVSWAIKLLARFDVKGDAEWARLNNAVFAEARAHGIPVADDDQERLCAVLASVEADDANAAAAYEQLYAARPDAVRPQQAWLYSRAAQVHAVGSERGLDLLALTCREDSPARLFFAQRQWDIDEVEYTYLKRLAAYHEAAANGRNGTAAKPFRLSSFDLTTAQQALLQSRSQWEEDAGDLEEATTAVEVLHRLADDPRPALDRLAQLHYRRGDLDRAATLLTEWHAIDPNDPTPLVRRAVVDRQRGDGPAAFEALRLALDRTDGSDRARIAFLGARLALADLSDGPSREQARSYLAECLRHDPDHVEARWLSAALLASNRAAVVELAESMDRPDADDPRFHYLAGVCQLAAGKMEQAVAAARRAAEADGPLALECAHLAGWARLLQGDASGAAAELRRVAGTTSPSADQARHLLGRIHFEVEDYDNAVLWWNAVETRKRHAWGLDEPLRDAALLAALLALRAGRFEQAADKLREAGRLGWRDRRLPALLNLARIRAAQRLLFPAPAEIVGEAAPVTVHDEVLALSPAAAAETAAWVLKDALQEGSTDPNAGYLLALAHKRQGQNPEALKALEPIPHPDGFIALQLGLLHLQERRRGPNHPVRQAEIDFHQAWQWCQREIAAGRGGKLGLLPLAACYNLLLTRLSLGEVQTALDLIPHAIDLAPGPHEQRFFALVQAVMQSGLDPQRDDLLAALSRAGDTEEATLLTLVRSLGNLEAGATLLRSLRAALPGSTEVRQTDVEVTLLQAKKLVERYRPAHAEPLLAALVWDQAVFASVPPPLQAAILNLLGCSACLCQDFEAGVRHFTAALKINESDPRVLQNLALAHELQGHYIKADPQWNRFLDFLDDRVTAPPETAHYPERLAFECLSRLATRSTEKESWTTALGYLQRAHQLRPEDPDILERLFQLNNQLRRPDDARQALERLRQVRANAPQFELYELELIEIRTVEDIDHLLTEIDRVLKQYPEDPAVTDRAGQMIGNVIGFIRNSARQHRDQLYKTRRSLNRMASYEIDWPEVNRFLRDMRAALNKLRRCVDRCLPLARTDQQRRQLRQQREAIEEDLGVCRSLAS